MLQIVTGLGPGGAERALLDLVAALDATRFDVRVVSIRDWLDALALYGHPSQPVSVHHLRGWRAPARFAGLCAELRAFAPHVVHAHMFHALLAAVLARRVARVPAALCFTSHLERHAPVRALVMRALRGERDVDVLFHAGQHPAMNAARTVVIGNGVPVPAQPPLRTPWRAGGPVRLVAVGRLAGQKDPLGLLHAFARADLPGATLAFVGTGPLEASARALAATLRLSDRVRFLGLRADVGACLRAADVFVMHSRTEGLPMALLEAGAEAMPVLATPVGAIGSLLGAHDAGGQAARSRGSAQGDEATSATARGRVASPAQYAAALRALVAAPDAAIAAGRRLHAHVRDHYAIAHIAAAHEALYERLAAGRGRRGRDTHGARDAHATRDMRATHGAGAAPGADAARGSHTGPAIHPDP